MSGGHGHRRLDCSGGSGRRVASGLLSRLSRGGGLSRGCRLSGRRARGRLYSGGQRSGLSGRLGLGQHSGLARRRWLRSGQWLRFGRSGVGGGVGSGVGSGAAQQRQLRLRFRGGSGGGGSGSGVGVSRARGLGLCVGLRLRLRLRRVVCAALQFRCALPEPRRGRDRGGQRGRQ